MTPRATCSRPPTRADLTEERSRRPSDASAARSTRRLRRSPPSRSAASGPTYALGEARRSLSRPRRVRLSELSLKAIEPTMGFLDVEIAVECSSGTYIRALARDVGAMLGVGGHLVMLRRNRVGPYRVLAAHRLDELAGLDSQDLPVILLDDAALEHFPTYVVDDSQVALVRNGRELTAQLHTATGCDHANPERTQTRRRLLTRTRLGASRSRSSHRAAGSSPCTCSRARSHARSPSSTPPDRRQVTNIRSTGRKHPVDRAQKST